MKTLKNILKKTIPILIFTACSSSPEPADELKKYALENKNLYASFKELIENKKYLTSKDQTSNAFINYEKYCVYLRKKDTIDKNFKITYIDYGIDGLTIDDEIIDYQTRFIKELSKESRLSTSQAYTLEIEKFLKENKIK